MRTWNEITNKILEILDRMEIPHPDFDVTTDIGRSRLILYFNKYKTEETHLELVNYLG